MRVRDSWKLDTHRCWLDVGAIEIRIQTGGAPIPKHLRPITYAVELPFNSDTRKKRAGAHIDLEVHQYTWIQNRK